MRSLILLVLALLVIVSTCNAECPSNGIMYFSVGQSTNDLKTGSPKITVASGVATFDVAQTGNIGVGDVILANSISYYISAKQSTTVWNVVTSTGGVPSDVTNVDVTSIKRVYTTLDGAITGKAQNLVTNNKCLYIPLYYDSGADTTKVNITGYTTGADNYIFIYTPRSTLYECNYNQRPSGKYDTSKYRLERSGGTNEDVLIIDEEFVRVKGIQIKHTTNIWGKPTNVYVAVSNATSDIRISDSVMVANFSTGIEKAYILLLEGPYTIIKAWNNVLYNTGTASSITEGFRVKVSVPAYLYNNTIYGLKYGFNSDSSDCVVKNNIAYNNSTADYYTSFSGSSDYNLSKDSTAPGTHSYTNKTLTFVDTGNWDFHLMKNDTDAIEKGTNLSQDTYIQFDKDADCETRPQGNQWDLGMDEFSSISSELSFTAASGFSTVNSVTYFSALSASSTAGLTIGDLPNYFSALGLSFSSDIALLGVLSSLTQAIFQGQGWITPEGIPGYNTSNNFDGISAFALNGESLTYSAIILGATSGISMSGLPSFYSQIAFESTSSLTIVNTLNYFSVMAISSTGGFGIDNLPNYFSDLGLSGLSNIGLSGSISGLDSDMLLSAISEILNLGDSTTTLNLLDTSTISFTDEPHYYSTLALSGSSGLTLVSSLYNYDGIGLSGTAGISFLELPSLFSGTSFSSTSGMTLANIADTYSGLILSNSSTFITAGIYSVELDYSLTSSSTILFAHVPIIESAISFTSTAWMPSLGIPGFNALQTITTPSSMVMNSNIAGISGFIANVSGSLLALSPIKIMSQMNLTGASYILMNISGYIFRGGSNVYERSFSSSFKKSITSSPAPY